MSLYWVSRAASTWFAQVPAFTLTGPVDMQQVMQGSASPFSFLTLISASFLALSPHIISEEQAASLQLVRAVNSCVHKASKATTQAWGNRAGRCPKAFSVERAEKNKQAFCQKCLELRAFSSAKVRALGRCQQ